jgi:ATP-dependent RNA helicase SUPV3L1/SUV3
LTFDNKFSKIKRIIFSTVRKWNGYKEAVIPLSEIKQIAGRAGRYGMHGPDSVGIATTLIHSDHRVVDSALKSVVPSLQAAVIAADSAILSKIHRCLPPNTGLGQIYQLLIDLATCEELFVLSEYQKLLDAAAIVDDACPNLSIGTRATLTQTPVPWKIPEAIPMFKDMLVPFAAGMKVDAEAVFEKAGIMLVLEDVSEARQEHSTGQQTPTSDMKNERPTLSVREASTRLEALELLHKMACVYLWLSYRYPIAFYQQERTKEIKLATELGIQFCLEMIQSERAKALKKHLEQIGKEKKNAARPKNAKPGVSKIDAQRRRGAGPPTMPT